MSAYEIAELRAMIGERLQSIIKFWLSATMAAFGVVYYIGAEMDGFTIAAILTFHGVMTVLSIALSRIAFGQISALERDAEQLNRDGAGANISAIDMIQIPVATKQASLGLYVVVFVAFIGYIIKMTI